MNYISYGQFKISEKERQIKNKNYIEQEIKNNKIYFDKMFYKIDSKIKLDEQQKRIVVTDEKYIMVIAGAGSGKTTTITAKVDYLIKKKHINPKEIIIITFTNKAVEELKQRINIEFNNKVKITTFHKLGYEIIKQNQKTPPRISNIKKEIILKLVKQELKKNTKTNYRIVKQFIKKKNIIKRIELFKNYKIEEETYEQITNICTNIISLLKAKNYPIQKLNAKKKYNQIIIPFIKNIYTKYEMILTKKNTIDFDDMINKATKIIETNKKINNKYKYIIIDEFQDISESRYKLIKKMSEKYNSKIMAVGDDWQCIYSFASSNINLFKNFIKTVPYCEILKIENTYRNSQQLIDIAGEFIQKNENQIIKKLKSNKMLDNPIKIIKYKKTINEKISNILEYLIKKYGEKSNILILGRYNFDKNEILKDPFIEEQNERIIFSKFPNAIIRFMTVHTAKGLGYDNVILINAKKTKTGFPSNIKNNNIINQIIGTETNIKYAEERRLFYVALTRTKNEVIILVPKSNPSCFIKEIKKNKNVIITKNINKNK